MSGVDLQLANSLYGKPSSAPDLPDAAYTSPEAAAAVRASQGIDVMGRAPSAEHTAATQAGEEQFARGRDGMLHRAITEYLQDVAARSAADAYKAKGWIAKTGYHLGAAAKGVGDAAAWTIGAAFKGGSALASGVTGSGFGHGWDVGGQNLQQMVGTSDPSILDLIPGISGMQEGLTLGQRADTEIQRKLGDAAIFSQTAGHLIGMVADPFAIGKGAAGATRMLSGAAERTAARMVTRGMPGAEVAVQQGKVWQLMAEQAGWKKAAGLIDRAAPILSQTVQAGAANIAQSFAMSPDAHRADAVKMAAYMTPFLLPIMRLGENLGGAAMRLGMTPEETAKIAGAYKLVENGQIGFHELDKVIAGNTRFSARVLGRMTAAAGEGTAFMAMDPNSWKELQNALGGDSEAWGRLTAQYLGTWAGVAAGKHMMPSHLTPFFKAVRPDANSLNTFLAAEANKRAIEEPAPQEPAASQEPAPDPLQQHEAAREQTLAKLRGAIERRSLPEQERIRAAADKAEADLRQNYGWAEGPSLGLLRGSWTPDLVDGTQDVVLSFGRDHSVVLGRDAADGTVLRFDPKLESILSDNGIPTVASQDRATLSPTMVEYRGEAAHKTLDDLTLVGLSERLRGDLVFQRVGFHEVSSGVWADENGRLYTRQLDGTTVSKGPQDKTWKELHHMEAAGFPDGPQWTNETTEQLKAWLIQKMVTAPDPAVDGVLHQAIAIAHNGTSFGSDQIRMFLSGMPIEALARNLQSPEGYRFLAMELGSLASSHNNAQFATIELGRDAMRRGGGPIGSRKMSPGRDQPYAGRKPTEGPITDRDVADVARQAAESPRVGQAVNALNPAPEPRPSSYREDAAREHLREQAKKFESDVQVEVGANQATLLKDWFPQNSDVAKQLGGLEAGGALTVTAKEAKKFVDYFARRADRQVRPETQAIDSFVSKLVEAHGLPTSPERGVPVEGAPMGRPPAPIGEPVSGEASGKPELREGPPETFGDRILGSPPKTASAGSTGGEAIKGELGKLGKAAKRAYDYAIESEPEVLTKRVPNDPLGYEVRKVRAEGARGVGEALDKWRGAEKALQGRGSAAKAIREGLIPSKRTEGASYARSRQLADKRITPENPTEQAFVESMQESGGFAYEAQRQAGAVRLEPQKEGPPKLVSLPKKNKFVEPMQPGDHWEQVHANADLRRRWHEVLVSENPRKMVPSINERGNIVGEEPLSAEWLQKNWEREQVQKAVPGAVRESAAEHLRFLENVPDVWDGYQMLDTDVFRRTTRTLRQQMSRASVLQEYGPEIAQDQRTAILKGAEETGSTSPVVEALRAGKFGVEDRLRRFADATTKLPEMTEVQRKRILEVARGALVRAQGGNPETPWAWTEMSRGFTKVTSSAMSAAAFVLDVPEPIFRTALYAGWANSYKAMRQIASSPKEMMQLMERLGVMDRQVADMAFEEAGTLAEKLSTAFQIPGTITERAKGLWNAVIAHNMVESINTGKLAAGERSFILDVGRLSPEQMAAIDSGKISDTLATQLKRELTQFLTSRSRPGEGSRMAASSNVGSIIRFTRFATKRLESTVLSAMAVAKSAKRAGWGSADNVRAILRLVRTQAGMAVGGAAGQMLAYMLTSAMRGEDPREGAKRLLREFSYAPLATLGKAWRNQLLGGPLAQIANAAIENKDAAAWAGTTIPGQIGYAISEFGHKVWSDPKMAADAMIGGFYDLGLIPLRSQLRGAVRAAEAARAGDNPQAISDARTIREWERIEGIEPAFGQKTKPEAFYDSIGKVVSIAQSMPDAPAKDVVEATMAELRKALDLAPEESVAAAIEGHMHTRSLSNEQRVQLQSFINDDERMTRIYQHDQALKDFAREVSKLEGVYPTPFRDELDQVQQQARHGGGDRWRGLMARVTDEATQKLLAGDSMSTDIDELAESMAAYPDQLEGLFDKSMSNFLRNDRIDSTAKARRIAAVLRNRVRDRKKDAVKEQMREKAEAVRGQ